MAFQIIQILYWLALSTWFGGVLFVAVVAPIIFRTIRESNPILPSVLSVNMEGQHGTLLAGTIVGNILRQMARIELVCAGAILIALILHFFLADVSDSNLTAAGFRSALFIASLAIVLIDMFHLSPRIQAARQEYLDNADEPDIANPAKDRFDVLHRQSVLLMGFLVFLLMGMILFSANIQPHKTSYVPTLQNTH